MLDYHLHLWPHSQSEAETTVEQVSAYCARAAAAGVTEIAVTEHLFRFTQAKDLLGGFWDDLPGDALRPGMSAYWDHHARVDLDDYVEVVQAVKAEGLPVVLGLEVDFYQGRMDQVARLLADYPFDVLLGSVHWLGIWRFDVLNEPETLAEWDVRAHRPGVGGVHRGHGGTGRLRGVRCASPTPIWSRSPAGCRRCPTSSTTGSPRRRSRSGMAAELSSAGWRKPLGEEYPAPPLLARFVDRGVPLTTASDAHALPDVADRVDDMRDLLARAGVPQLQGYRDRRPYPVPVAPAGGARS